MDTSFIMTELEGAGVSTKTGEVQLISQAEAVDAAEDKLYGVGQQPQDLPAELQRREGRREKIRALRAALEKETAKARAAELVEFGR